MKSHKMTETALYRHFDADGYLLYVGISLAPLARTRQHRLTSAWIRDVVRVDIEWYASRRRAERAEWEAIRAEKPLYNLAFGHRTPAPGPTITVLDARGNVLT